MKPIQWILNFRYNILKSWNVHVITFIDFQFCWNATSMYPFCLFFPLKLLIIVILKLASCQSNCLGHRGYAKYFFSRLLTFQPSVFLKVKFLSCGVFLGFPKCPWASLRENIKSLRTYQEIWGLKAPSLCRCGCLVTAKGNLVSWAGIHLTESSLVSQSYKHGIQGWIYLFFLLLVLCIS